MRYLWTTKEFGIEYDGMKGINALGYSDSDFVGCPIERKYTSGYIFLIAGGAVSWKSKKQTIDATSSSEAEYIASCAASKEAIWLSRLISELTG